LLFYWPEADKHTAAKQYYNSAADNISPDEMND